MWASKDAANGTSLLDCSIFPAVVATYEPDRMVRVSPVFGTFKPSNAERISSMAASEIGKSRGILPYKKLR